MRCRYTNKEVELLARLMRSEALGEGVYGMKLVGNVVINRVVAKCTTFKNINTIYDAIFQKGQFEGTKTPLFNGRPNKAEKQRAMDCIKYWRGDPAYKALFFQNPGKINLASRNGGEFLKEDIRITVFIIQKQNGSVVCN